MCMLLETALALFAGLMMTRVFKYMKLNFPDVTAFLIAGVLVGPFVLGRLGIHGFEGDGENGHSDRRDSGTDGDTACRCSPDHASFYPGAGSAAASCSDHFGRDRISDGARCDPYGRQTVQS